MKCLVTGASSGIGKDMCKILSEMGHQVIMVSSNSKKLEEACKDVKGFSTLTANLSTSEGVSKVIDLIKKEKPEIVVNDAGFGAFGYYDEVSLDKEMEMVNVNVIALHKITKACLEYMGENNYILNVASIAGLMPGGPLLSTYYATKSYVRSYTLGIYEELKKKNSKVNISVLCPGPVDTNFNKVAGGIFSINSLTSDYVSKYAIDKMFKKKLIIIPGFSVKMGYFFHRFVPTKTLLSMMFKIQHKKRNY